MLMTTSHIQKQHIRLYCGLGKGEFILKCDDIKLIFTGDDLVNIKGFTQDSRNLTCLHLTNDKCGC